MNEIENLGLRIADRTAILPNWVTAVGAVSRNDYRPNGHLRLINAGSFGLHKGTDIIIRAAAILRARGISNFSIDLFGMGSDSLFQTMILSSGLDMVRIQGYRTQAEMDAIYRQYDVFLFPTWAREPFGIAPLEAMSHGCLAIVSQMCAISEWLLDGFDCVKVERTAEGLADGIAKVCSGEYSLEEIGTRASRTASTWYSLSTVLPKIVRILSDAANGGRGASIPSSDVYRLARICEQMVGAMRSETAA